MKIIECKQNTTEWINARLGVVTASEIDALVTPTGKVSSGKGVETYLYKKLTERVLGMPLSDFSSFAMEQGAIVELEAVPWYAFAHNVMVQRVGFCTSDDGKYGFSPDGLIGEEGGLEIKSPQPAKHLQYLLEGKVPDDYVLQVQFSLYVSQRKWWKFVSYSRQLPALVLNVEPDPKIQVAIGQALGDFLPKFDAKLAQVARMKAEHDSPLKEAYEAKIREWEKTGKIP